MVEQTYLFSLSEAENIVGAIATDGTTVQYMSAKHPRDSRDVKDIEDALLEKLERGVPEGLTPVEYLGTNLYYMITDPFEFDSFDAAAQAAQELFDRGAVADEFVIE